MSYYREHYRPGPVIRPAVERIGGALILAVCLSWLGPTFLDAEDAMPITAPVVEADMLTAEGLAEYRREHECCNGDCNQGRRCPMRMPAEAATDVGAEPSGRPRDGWLTGLWLRFVRWAG